MAKSVALRKWERRARRELYYAIGVTCPRCWRPLQPAESWVPTFCRCGEGLDVLEETLAAHGLAGTTLRFTSSGDVYCG